MNSVIVLSLSYEKSKKEMSEASEISLRLGSWMHERKIGFYNGGTKHAVW